MIITLFVLILLVTLGLAPVSLLPYLFLQMTGSALP